MEKETWHGAKKCTQYNLTLFRFRGLLYESTWQIFHRSLAGAKKKACETTFD